jgi:HAD superfamily hydrolase (TIGR01549 family)
VYDAVLFDMDGVLLTGRHTDRSVYEATAERVLAGYDHPDPAPELVEAFVSPNSADAFRASAEDHGLPAEAAWADRERVASELEAERIRAGEREPFPDVGALDALDTVGVVSNNRQETVAFAVEHLGIDADVAVGREPTLEGYERLKPEPYYVAAALSEIDAEDALYVGDRYTDAAAAHAAGAAAALVDRPGMDAGEPVADPEYEVDSLNEVAELA